MTRVQDSRQAAGTTQLHTQVSSKRGGDNKGVRVMRNPGFDGQIHSSTWPFLADGALVSLLLVTILNPSPEFAGIDPVARRVACSQENASSSLKYGDSGVSYSRACGIHHLTLFNRKSYKAEAPITEVIACRQPACSLGHVLLTLDR